MEELRFGVIGWGYWGPKLMRNLTSIPRAQVTMVADLDSKRLAQVARDYPWTHTTTAAADLLASDIDAVAIATPVKTHYSLAKQALLSGKHVLVEKPLTANVAEAEELVELAGQLGSVLMVGHTFEYSPAVNELRRLIRTGVLGNIYTIHTERLNLGLFRSDIDVIWDLAPHDISILLYLLGERPERVEAIAEAHLHPQIYDTAHLHLEFPSGTSAHIHVSWLFPTKTRRVVVVGNRRMAIYDDVNPAEMLKVFNKGADMLSDPVVSYRQGETTIPYIEWDEPLRLECEDFAQAIRLHARPRAHGKVGLEVVSVLAAAQQALSRHTMAAMPVLMPLPFNDDYRASAASS